VGARRRPAGLRGPGHRAPADEGPDLEPRPLLRGERREDPRLRRLGAQGVGGPGRLARPPAAVRRPAAGRPARRPDRTARAAGPPRSAARPRPAGRRLGGVPAGRRRTDGDRRRLRASRRGRPGHRADGTAPRDPAGAAGRRRSRPSPGGAVHR
jgi:hypothetical protein